MEEKLLTRLNSALKVLIGLDIFPRVPKKKLNFVDQCNLSSKVKFEYLPGYCAAPKFSPAPSIILYAQACNVVRY